MIDKTPCEPVEYSEQISCPISIDAIPEELLDRDQLKFLFSSLSSIREWNERPKPTDVDYSVAMVMLTRFSILRFAEYLIARILFYVLSDVSLSAKDKERVKPIELFACSNIEQQMRDWLMLSSLGSLGFNQRFPASPPNVIFSGELQMLSSIGGVFFVFLQKLFPVRAVDKCHIAFTLLIQNFGKDGFLENIENYIRRRKTLYREIVSYQEEHSTRKSEITAALAEASKQWGISEIQKKLDLVLANQNSDASELKTMQVAVNDNTSAIAENTKVMKNMDRRQNTLLSVIRTIMTNFALLFKPGHAPLTRETVATALLPDERYMRLQNLNEPHRSQIMAVVNWTKQHPIVKKEDNKEFQLTLASAALTVWNAESKNWERDPGSFKTYKSLKAACYNLAEDEKTNPFYYKCTDKE